MIRRLAVALALVCVAAAHPVSAQRFMYTGCSDSDVLAYLAKLQKAVAGGNRAAVAGMVKYPLRVNRDETHHIVVADNADLLRRYDAVFTPTIRDAILKQKPADLSGGRDGVAIKAGLVWLGGSASGEGQSPKCRLSITSVNLHGEK